MRLFEAPPESLFIDGVKYPIDTDFRRWIEFQTIMTKDNSNDEKTADLIDFIESLGLPFSEGTLPAIIDFFSGGEKRKTNDSQKKAYDFELDSGLIFSAFMTQYAMDLTTEHIHWWKFKAMFSSLSEEHIISKIMWARTADTSKMSKEMKEYADRLKAAYPLTVSESGHKMTLQERNKKWVEYVARRFEEAEKSRMSTLRGTEQSSVDR